MISGAVMIFFTGFVNVWSVFVPYVMTQTGWTQGSVTMAFYISNCFFVIGNILGGKLSRRWSVRKIIAAGGGIFAGAIFLSGISVRISPFLLYLTYGVLMGAGAGMAYSVILATAQKWFPDRTGFASGVIIASNGLCGFFIAPLCRSLLAHGNVSAALWVIGAMVAAAWLFASFSVTEPDMIRKTQGKGDRTGKAGLSQTLQTGRQYTSEEMLHSRNFYYLVAAMFFGLMPYYLISPVSQVFQMEHGVSEGVAVMSVMLGALLNAATRLLLPTAADRMGRFRCLTALLCVSAVSSLMLTFGTGTVLTAAVILAYGCFGGVMGSFPSLCSMLFGLEHAGENYGYVMIGMILSALLAPLITGALEAAGFGGARLYICSAVFAAAAVMFLAALKKRQYDGVTVYKGEVSNG